MKTIAKSLRIWFLVHFVLDYIFGLPLLLAPNWFLGLFGIEGEVMITARLVGAALLGIGGASLLMHKKGVEAYEAMLVLKMIWSGVAMVALLLAIRYGAPMITWLIFVIYLFFFCLWWFYHSKNKK